MRCNKLFASAVLGLSVIAAAASPASAAFTWDVAPSPGHQLSIKLANWEPDLGTVIAEDNLFGVGIITQIINDTTGINAWTAALNPSEELTFVFSDYELDSITAGGAAGFEDDTFNFTGGLLSVYFDDDPDVNLDNTKLHGTNAAPDNPADDAAGDNFDDGILMGDFVGHANADGFTLIAEIDDVFPVSGFQGSGGGLLSVVPGTGYFADAFDSNDYGFGADAEFTTDLDTTGAGPGFYPIRSDDPVNATFVPEPVSLVVWSGLAFVIGGVAYRKRRAA